MSGFLQRIFSKAFDNVKHSLVGAKVKALPLNPYVLNWFLSFLMDRKQRLIFKSVTYKCHSVNKGTTQGSVSRPHLFNLFINDLSIMDDDLTSIFKYADDTTMQVKVCKDEIDLTLEVVNQFSRWTQDNAISCNLEKCSELVLCKKVAHDVDQLNNITQVSSLKVLGVTLQSNHRFNEHIKVKLQEANKCLYVIRCLRKEGYLQSDIGYVYRSMVLPKLTYGLPIYAASTPELTTVQKFLQRCFKRRYISYILEEADRAVFKKISSMPGHPFYPFLPQNKRKIIAPQSSKQPTS